MRTIKTVIYWNAICCFKINTLRVNDETNILDKIKIRILYFDFRLGFRVDQHSNYHPQDKQNLSIYCCCHYFKFSDCNLKSYWLNDTRISVDIWILGCTWFSVTFYYRRMSYGVQMCILQSHTYFSTMILHFIIITGNVENIIWVI